MSVDTEQVLERDKDASHDKGVSITERSVPEPDYTPTDFARLQQFSLLGGPLYRLGCRLGLVRGTNTVTLGLVLGILPWLVLLALVLIDGLGQQFLTMRVIAAHVRLLVLIPLLFIGESALDPRMASFVNWTLRARAVATHSRPALEAEIVRIGRWKDSWLLELFCLAAALLAQPLVEKTGAIGISMTLDPTHSIASHSLSAWWW